jgi:glucosylceramidase
VLPALKEAFSINPDILVMASPWSAPGWMKTSDSMVGGWLRTDRYAPFAQYFVKFVQAYEAEGIPIDFITVANEPLYIPKDYPGMYMAAPVQAQFIRDYLGPALARAGLTPQVLTFDHNWSQAQYALDVLQDASAQPYVAGSAFHCYSGQPSAMGAVHSAFPSKAIHVTECSSFSTGNTFENALLWNARTLVTGSLRHWAESVVLWNLVLDEQGGPHAGGCTDCTGLAMVHSTTGAVTFNGEFYALVRSRSCLPTPHGRRAPCESEWARRRASTSCRHGASRR